MGFADWLSRNRRGAGALIVVAVLLAGVLAVQSRSGPRLENQRYFYDLGTGKSFPGDRLTLPPITSPSGAGEAVGAIVLGCGECDDPAHRTVGWLETYTPEALELARITNPTDEMQHQSAMARGHLLARPPASDAKPVWVVYDSPEGAQIRNQVLASACPGGEKPQLCLP